MISRDDIVCFLNKNGIEAKLLNKNSDEQFQRNIYFKVYDIEYNIKWFINENILEIGIVSRLTQIPFKYLYLDTTYPIIGGNISIGFAYNKISGNFYRKYPFECFRIPIPIQT